MALYDFELLDCTLRDGGYVNDWRWGFSQARDIIRLLVKSHVDVVEVGFLRNIDEYNPDMTVCNHIEELNRLLPDNCGKTMFSAMAMRSNYDISKLSPYSGTGIEMIRITAHDYDIADGMDFAKEVKDKGYKLSINPINIMGYTDEQILWILNQVNSIQPYQFSIVDTFGSMKRRDLDRIVNIVDNNLDKNIRVALHLHENMSLSCCLAQRFIDFHLNRPIAVDGSLMGMGRIPGNLPIELISDYLNDYANATYDIDYMMDAIQDYIAPIKGETEWGYTPAYFLSARYNLHRNYAEHFLKKGDLTNRDINHILARFDKSKTTVFDAKYADTLYEEYKNNVIDDTKDFEELKKLLLGKKILVMAPGASLLEYQQDIEKYIRECSPVIISVNFVPSMYRADYVFFSNSKRFESFGIKQEKLIVTSNIATDAGAYHINYNRLSSAFRQGFNSYIMLLKLLKDMGIEQVEVAGADGFVSGAQNYFDSSIRSIIDHGINYNQEVTRAVKNLEIGVKYITPSMYSNS